MLGGCGGSGAAWCICTIRRRASPATTSSRLVELPGEAHLLWADPDPVFDLVEEFVTGVPATKVPDRVLLTVVFSDIVAATVQAAAVGDEVWRRTLDRHDDMVGRLLARYRGEQVKSTGDGVLAVFDGPARAVRWAQSVTSAVRELGLRAGPAYTRARSSAGELTSVVSRSTSLPALPISPRLLDCGPVGWPRRRVGMRLPALSGGHLVRGT